MNSQPNPFNSTTTIYYTIPFNGNVTLELYDYMGALVSSIASEEQLQGSHSIKIDATNIAAGVYFAKLTVKNNSDQLIRTIKLINNH